MPTPRTASARSARAKAEERRIASRYKAYAEVWADPGGMAPAIPCKLIDISGTGAKLFCYPGNAALPEKFVLHTGHVKHVAQIVWRDKSMVGVEFEPMIQPYHESGLLPDTPAE